MGKAIIVEVGVDGFYTVDYVYNNKYGADLYKRLTEENIQIQERLTQLTNELPELINDLDFATAEKIRSINEYESGDFDQKKDALEEQRLVVRELNAEIESIKQEIIDAEKNDEPTVDLKEKLEKKEEELKTEESTLAGLNTEANNPFWYAERLAESENKLIKKNTEINRLKAKLNNNNIKLSNLSPEEEILERRDAWCADYFPELIVGDEVGTIEPNRNEFDNYIYPVVIKPFVTNNNDCFWKPEDGIMDLNTNSVQWAYNYAMSDGSDVWKPNYIFATVVSVDKENNTGQIIVSQLSKSPKDEVEPIDVTFSYMDCNADGFEVYDPVVVDVSNEGNYKVVGFQDNPYPCNYDGEQSRFIFAVKVSSSLVLMPMQQVLRWGSDYYFQDNGNWKHNRIYNAGDYGVCENPSPMPLNYFISNADDDIDPDYGLRSYWTQINVEQEDGSKLYSNTYRGQTYTYPHNNLNIVVDFPLDGIYPRQFEDYFIPDWEVTETDDEFIFTTNNVTILSDQNRKSMQRIKNNNTGECFETNYDFIAKFSDKNDPWNNITDKNFETSRDTFTYTFRKTELNSTYWINKLNTDGSVIYNYYYVKYENIRKLPRRKNLFTADYYFYN